MNHNLLLSKLYNVGFRGFIYDWLAPYLRNRFQVVMIENVISSKRPINTGVTQVSLLCPKLFLTCGNSLFLQPFIAKVTAFAADASHTYSSTSYLQLVSDVNFDIDLLRKWFYHHKLTISNKTKFMLFSIKGEKFVDLPLQYHAPNAYASAYLNFKS